MTPARIIPPDELACIERGLYDRLAAAPTKEALTDLNDFATRKLQQVLASHRALLRERAKS